MSPHYGPAPTRNPRVVRGGIPWLVLCKAAQAERNHQDPLTLDDFVAMRFTTRAHLINTFRRMFYAGMIYTERTAKLTGLGWAAYAAPLPARPGSVEEAKARRVIHSRPEDPISKAEALTVLGDWLDHQHIPLRIRRAFTALKDPEKP